LHLQWQPTCPLRVDLNALVLVPSLTTPCGLGGVGLAVCPLLCLAEAAGESVVTSDMINDTVSMFSLPCHPLDCLGATAGTSASAGLNRVCTLGGATSPAPMQFKFRDASATSAGCMAFTGRLLLLTDDAGHNAVHVIDVVDRGHVGYVAAPGTIAGPRGVAVRGSLAAVSAGEKSRQRRLSQPLRIKRPPVAHQSYTFVPVWDLTPMRHEALFVNLGHGTGHHRIS
jgi:hypothetical protein